MTVRASHGAESAHPAGQGPPPGGAVLEDPAAFLDRLEGRVRSGARYLAESDAAALDALALRCARGHGAYELAIGEGLDLLDRRRGEVRLGSSGVGDLARERLGLSADRARRLRRNAGKLRARPLLRAAIVRGDVTSRKAEIVLRRAVGSEEAYWTARASADTVRTLVAAVQGDAVPEEADWHRIRVGLPAEDVEIVKGADFIAGVMLGPTAPRARRIEAMMMEFLAEFPVAPREQPAWRREAPPAAARGSPARGRARSTAPAAPTRADVACGFQLPGAELLGRPSSGAAGGLAAPGRDSPRAALGGDSPAGAAPPLDPYQVLARLEHFVRERAGLDEHLGRAAILVHQFQTWRGLGYRSFDHWCAEHLGMAPRTVRQRMALERRMQTLPPLREAFRARRISYEQARLISRVATAADVAERIEQAASTTCIALRRALDGEEEGQMWRANELSAVAPSEVSDLVEDAIQAARLHLGPGLTPGEAVVLIAAHFVLTWAREAKRILRATDAVVLRDGGLCTVPGCSRAVDHVHHVVYRSDLGGDEPSNRTSLCAVHHLQGVHAGNVLVTGSAPDALTFVLGEREVRAARG